MVQNSVYLREPGARNWVNFMSAAYQVAQYRFCAVVTSLRSQQDGPIGVLRPDSGRENRYSKPVTITESRAWNNCDRIDAVLQEKSDGFNSAKSVGGNSQLTSCAAAGLRRCFGFPRAASVR